MKKKESKKWSPFFIKDLFHIYTGRDLILSNIKKGCIPIVSHSKVNNGITEWSEVINNQKLFNHKTTISLADRGNFHAFTQNINFYIGTRVKALEIKKDGVGKYVLVYISKAINMQASKFSYGNNATAGINKLKIILPTNSQNEPDYDYMESYIKDLKEKKEQEYFEYISI